MKFWGRHLWAVVYVAAVATSAWAHDSKLEDQLCEALLAPASGNWQGKTVIIDTNVLFNDPNALYKFPGATVIIPGTVHEELDDHKKDLKLGRSAREFFRMMDKLVKEGGSLKKGIQLGNGATVKLDSQDYGWMMTQSVYDKTKHDNRIVATALYYLYEIGDPEKVVLISDDSSARLKAASEDLRAVGFDYDFVPANKEKVEEATYLKLKINNADLEKFKATGVLPKPQDFKIAPNQFVMLEADGVEGSPATLARYIYDREAPEKSGLKKLQDFSHLPFQPKNIEQAMLLDILMDPSIHLVISESPAGTGKTFMALLAGMLQVNSPSTPYEQLMVTRTLVQIGKENLGAFPGSKEEKLSQWSENYSDALKAISRKANEVRMNEAPRSETKVSQILENNYKGQHQTHKQARMSRAERRQAREQREAAERRNSKMSNKVQLVAFPHLRGRSIDDSFLIMDEAQNSSVHEIKTFLTRAGEGSKLIVLGDASQIDLPYLNERNNGLSVTVSLFTQETLSEEQRSLVGYVRLTEGVRSALAEMARQLFERPIPNN